MDEKRRLLGAAAVGLGALGAGELLAAARGGSPLDGLGRLAADYAPVPVVETMVARAGRHDKEMTRLGVALGGVAAAAGMALLPPRLRTPAAVAFGAGTAAAALRSADRSVPGALGGLTAAAVLRAGLRRRPTGFGGEFLWAAAGTGMLAAAESLLRRDDLRHREQARRVGPMGAHAPVPEDGIGIEPGLTPLITAAGKFYVADVNSRPPRIDPTQWRLSIGGKVAHHLRLSLADLAEQAVEFDAVMVCVHNTVGSHRCGNARWFGVPLTTLLEHAVPESGATRLVTRAVDGYTISLPLEPLRTGEWPGYLVIGMNGEALPPEHGFPARVFVPGIYGQYTGAKWITELELADDTHVDYWWKRGWPAETLWVRPESRIDVATCGPSDSGKFTVAGVAWAPPHGVSGVELRIDETEWFPVELGSELAPAAWRRWRTIVDLPPGTHTIQARAISRSGEVQDAGERPPFPIGPGGLHTVTVTA
ncbi:molybdopterin-dependent oxidoreductase [Nocardia seriolae]|uniref:molybdopterin-dependent oxidoreductase n=3 Tax=Nocardia seriolae TaxID=37332 RepID=UPI001314FDF4|nr:molybdopterin-dependent oxidoreductase [Nocardia seriolae]QOW33964.1 molybdopterin-dependent oxidoreductase [Nocardia seriolae]QUN18540.1 molybdopterin-dependent oxidoreductase [Nocardia seriolae]WKY54329.1 molybdopterin-dependent oxidoreductase [Nocardia seriolae]WNJ61176.1 molybdopterin-dependent oxidoreductase [Nocardia seriolae]